MQGANAVQRKPLQAKLVRREVVKKACNDAHQVICSCPAPQSQVTTTQHIQSGSIKLRAFGGHSMTSGIDVSNRVVGLNVYVVNLVGV